MTNNCNGAACATQGASRTGSLADCLAKNKKWSESVIKEDPEYFKRLMDIQEIEVLWLGCSDAKVPANALIGLRPGEVFVQRNVGNLATHKDMNVMSCLEYAVQVLKVKHVIVCGHYGCDAVKAALTNPCKNEGLVNLWIQDIRDTRDRNVEALRALQADPAAQHDKLVELNVLRQVFNVTTSPVVQQAWEAGQQLEVHGLVYSLSNGELKKLYTTESSPHTKRPGSLVKLSNAGLASRTPWANGGAGPDAAPPAGGPKAHPVDGPRLSYEL